MCFVVVVVVVVVVTAAAVAAAVVDATSIPLQEGQLPLCVCLPQQP